MKYYNFYQAARLLNMGIGRNMIFSFMQSKGIINKAHIPKQELVDAGYLRYEYKEMYKGKTSYKIRYVLLTISDAGLQWLKKLLEDSIAENKALVIS